jgi:small-conductance mechanosensitive channel
VAVVTGAGFLLTRLNYVAGASVAATIASNCAVSLSYAAVAGLILVSFGRGQGAGLAQGEAAPAASATERRLGPAWTLISLVLATAIVVTLGAVLAGYTTLAALTSGQIFWLSLIAGAAYLMMRFADDLATAMFSPRGWASRSLYQVFNFRRSTIGQSGVLISAALQLVVLVGAICLALTPFGNGGDQLVAHLSDLAAPIKLGSATISPGAIAAGIATFVIGMGAVRTVQRWTVRRYLPVTDWDPGVRNSVTTGVGYLGVCIAVLCALAATGLGFNQIALVASALSVGIGFGLQTVVQNFVSGVILLVERPVKVGDRVSVGGLEGDIRRIRVRATEIETVDHTTVIVPNSDLITKAVENRTLGQSRSLVQLELSIAQPAQAKQAREIILGIAACKSGLAKAPAPQVLIKSLAATGGVNLSCSFYAEDISQAPKLRSDCYFQIMDALAQDEIAFSGVRA